MPNTPKATLLIVDDEAQNLHHLGSILKEEFEILLATNGEEALRRCAENTADLILLDIVLPDMDGYEVCQRLQTAPETREIPVIFVTAKSGIQDEARGLQVGAVDYITKPYQPAIIMARVRTQLALRQQKARLLELNEVKNRFLGIAAHDLRNPLSTIRGMSQLLLDFGEVKESDRRTYLQAIYQTSEQMLSLVNDLLDVTVIESGSFDLNILPTDLARLVDSRLQLQLPHAERKGISITRNLNGLSQAALDPNRMSQVIDNLLSNAIKFSPPDTEITISCEQDSDGVKFSVQDQGPGIPEDELDKIFQPFQRLSVKSTDGEKSTGLGMAIVNKIVSAHGGEIEVDSQVGKGTHFIVYLPDK